MPFDGIGNFIPLPSPVYPAVPNTPIEAEKFNATVQDIFGGLSNTLTRDGQSAPMQNLPMAGFRFLNVGDAQDLGEFVSLRQLKADSATALIGYDDGLVYPPGSVGKALQDLGAIGAGLNGYSQARLFIYARGASAPPLPSAAVTYNFTTGALTGLNNGWTVSIPAGTGPVWVSGAAAISQAATDNIAPAEWATAILYTQDGLNSATVMLYQRTTTGVAPAQPTVSSTYTFASGVLTAVDQGWMQGLPPTGGNYLWMIAAIAVSAGASDTILSGEWSAARVHAQNGADGIDGIDGDDGIDGENGGFTDYAYRRAATAPATPSGDGTPIGWFAAPPVENGQPLWMSRAGKTWNNLLVGSWSTPIRFDGIDGVPGATYYTGTIYRQQVGTPATPEGGTFNFATQVLSPPSGWTAAPPSVTVTPTWACDYIFVANTPLSTVTAGTWEAPYIDAVAGTPGSIGPNGASVLVLEVYLQAGSQPATPTGGFYNFSTDAFTAPAGGWSRSMPTSSTTPTWRAAFRFTTSTPAIDVAAGDYSLPVKVAQDGSSPQSMKLGLSSNVMSYDTNGTPVPADQTITITATLINTSGTATFVAALYDALGAEVAAVTLGGGGNVRTLTLAQFGAAMRCQITATLGLLTETVTILRAATLPPAAAPVASPGTFSVYAARLYESGSTTVTATVEFRQNGTIWRTATVASSGALASAQLGSWYLPATGTPGDDYTISFVKLGTTYTGGTVINNGGVLSSTRKITLTHTDSVQWFYDASFAYTISRTLTGVAVSSGIISLENTREF